MSDRLPRPRRELDSLRTYRTQQQPANVRLQANEWAEPNPVSRYLTESELDAILVNRYPDAGAGKLRAILADQWRVAPEQLMFGNGSNEMLLQTFLVFGGPGRTVLFFTPTYTMYQRFGQITGTATADERVGLPYDLEPSRVRAAIAKHRPDMICLCRPNNPTGNAMPEACVTAAAESAPEALVVLDEAYSEFAETSLVPLLRRHPNLIIAKTFSKVRAAAGLRVGVLIADPRLVAVFDAVRLPYNVSTLTQVVAEKIAATTDVAGRVGVITREREKVQRGLAALSDIEAFPSTTNFILFRHRARVAAELHASILEDGVLVRDVSMWPGADNCLRVTIGTADENERFLRAIERAVGAVRAKVS